MLTTNPWGRQKLNLRGVHIQTDQKEWVARDIVAGKHSGAYWDARYNLPKNTSKDWANIYEKKGFISNVGRPSKLSENDIKILEENVNNSTYDISKSKFDDLADKFARERATTVLNQPLSVDYHLSSRTRRRIDEILGIKDAQAERQTIARANAEMDTRNLVSFAAANHYMVSKTPHQLLINSDATQFQVGGLLTKKMAVKIKIGRKSSIDPMKVLPEKNEELSAFFIKYYAIMSAGGYLSDPIFIIADPSMDAGDIDVYDVKGLGIGIDASNKGTLVFCKDRTLCNEYYDWLIEHKILDFVHYIKNQCELEDDDLTWYTLDGESKQLSPFTSERIIKILSDNNIVVGKPPGSSTRIMQPCDAYQFFKAIKTALRAKKKNAINPVLEARLTTIFGQHEDTIYRKVLRKIGKYL
jgi:transposase